MNKPINGHYLYRYTHVSKIKEYRAYLAYNLSSNVCFIYYFSKNTFFKDNTYIKIHVYTSTSTKYYFVCNINNFFFLIYDVL